MLLPPRSRRAAAFRLVVDSSNAPVSGAPLNWPVRRDARSQSGARGTYSFASVAAGTYEDQRDAGRVRPAAPREHRGCKREGGRPAIQLALGAVTDTVVITASRAETALVDAPATMSVDWRRRAGDIAGPQLRRRAAHGAWRQRDSAVGARHELTSRQATHTLANSELVLVDGRSLYLDFFGMVLWTSCRRTGTT